MLQCQPGDIIEYIPSIEDTFPVGEGRTKNIPIMPSQTAEAIVDRNRYAAKAAIEAYLNRELSGYEDECLYKYFEIVMYEFLETEKPSAMENSLLYETEAQNMCADKNLPMPFKEAVQKLFVEKTLTEKMTEAMEQAYKNYNENV